MKEKIMNSISVGRRKWYLVLLVVLCQLLASYILSFAQSPSTYWWNDAVFYEVFVRSFKDSNGDGKGDFKGLMEKLDYLNDGNPATHNDLGITAIWLMPVQESPSYHGYDVTDYRTIEQDYGTNADFLKFMDEAHKRGIKVIIDYVMNHTSTQHPWFISSTNPNSDKRSWYVWQNTNPGTTAPWNGSQAVWHSNNGSYYYGIFWSGMPDLNYNTPAVKTEMFNIAKFWLQDMKVDGFRLDAVKYIFESGNTLEDTPQTIQFWKDFRTYYKSVKPDAFAVGEAWTSTDKVKPYVNDGGLDYCFEFDLANTIISAANNGNASALKTQVDKVMGAYPYLQFGTFLSNHDMDRVMSQLFFSVPKAKVAANLLLTLPGVPYIYYGEEIGMTGKGADENKRTPLMWNSESQAGFTTGTPWRTVNADYEDKNIALQQYDTSSLWNTYKRLITIRNQQTALRRGNYQSITTSDAAQFAFLRQYLDENIIVVVNTGSTDFTNVQISLPAAGIAQGSYILAELQGGKTVPVTVDNTGGFSNLSIGALPAQNTVIYKLVSAAAPANSITFEVDMRGMIAKGDFDPAKETVDIVATFNHFGTDSITKLTDPDEDGIYSVTIPDFTLGSKINYKYRINGVNDGREEFPNSANVREYYVTEGTNTVRDNYKNLVYTGINEKKMNIDFNVYPVPAGKEIFIDFQSAFSGPVQYQIIDLLGVERISSSFRSAGTNGQQIISCEGLPSGIYILTLKRNGGSRTSKIVIRN